MNKATALRYLPWRAPGMKASHSEAARRPVRIQVAHHARPKGAVVSVDEDNLTRAGAEQRDRLQALYRLALELTELREVQHVLDVALRQCLTLTASQFGFIGLTGKDGSGMDVVAIQGYEVSKR